MSRFLLLLVYILWMALAPETANLSSHHLVRDVVVFLGVYAAGLGLLGLWSRSVAHSAGTPVFHDRWRRFQKAITSAKFLIPLWFGVGMYLFHWGDLVRAALDLIGLGRFHFELPGALIGALPAKLAWIGMWWAQYPAERALKEQNLLVQLDSDMPVYAPSPFWVYMRVNLRLQLLFTLAPLLVLVGARDVLSVLVPWVVGMVPGSANHHVAANTIEGICSGGATILMFLFAPELLRRVLQTETFPDSPLRDRMTQIARQSKIRFRDILLWRTEHNMGNAAAMGLVPFARYILISDLILETMTPDQVEAVFAHEIGHIRHRHLWWLVIFFSTLMLAFTGVAMFADDLMVRLADYGWHLKPWVPDTVDTLLMLSGVGVFAATFGFLSRKFERQADVFAARTIESRVGSAAAVERKPADAVSGDEDQTPATPAPGVALPSPASFHVGRQGASVMAAALGRVAHINNIPATARSWDHGSIAHRMRYLHELSLDPARTFHFDRFMRRLYVAMTIALLAFGAWTAFATVKYQGTDGKNGQTASLPAASAMNAKP